MSENTHYKQSAADFSKQKDMLIHIFAIVECFFEIWPGEMLENHLLISKYISCYIHSFTMVEENFEIWLDEML